MIVEIVTRLWGMSLQAGILILVVLAVRFCLSRYPRIYSYCLWSLVGIKLLCPVWLESSFSLQPDFFISAENTAQEESGAYGQNARSSSPIPQAQHFSSDTAPESPKEMPANTPDIQSSMETSAASSPESGMQKTQIYMLLCIVYCIGIASLALFYLFQYFRIRIRLSSAVREKGNVWLSDSIASPFVMGIICPKIYLPYHISQQDKKYVLRHERMHILHFDPLIRIISTLCLILHWWNPLVWIGVYFMNQDMEMFCDESVLRHASLEERKAYAKTLLSFAGRNAGIGIGLAFIGESHTEKRIKNIMKKRKRSLWIICLLIVLAVFCIVALLTVPKTAENTAGQENDTEADASKTDENPTALSLPDSSKEEEIPVHAETDAPKMTADSCEVEMNPYGKVTFAVYAPDLSISPYADATYKLLRDGKEIYSFPLQGTGVRQDESAFAGIAALAFPDINGDGYTDVVTISHYEHASEPVPSQIRIFTYNAGGYFLEETYLEEAFTISHETKTLAEIQEFISQPENQDYFVRTSIYGRWQITGYRTPGVYALSQEEIDRYIGTGLEYDIDTMRSSTEESPYVVTQYEKSVITTEELETSFRISRDSLNLTAEELISFQLETESDSLFGCFFYLTDAEHAYIYYDGVFFEAVRN